MLSFLSAGQDAAQQIELYSASGLISTGMLRLLLHRSLSHLNNDQIGSFQKDMLSLSLGLAPKCDELKWNINSDLD